MAEQSTTTSWTGDELATIGRAEELGLASPREDGTLRPYVTMWVVRARNDVFDFELTGEQLAAIDALDTGKRGGPEPEAMTLEAFGRPIPEA